MKKNELVPALKKLLSDTKQNRFRITINESKYENLQKCEVRLLEKKSKKHICIWFERYKNSKEVTLYFGELKPSFWETKNFFPEMKYFINEGSLNETGLESDNNYYYWYKDYYRVYSIEVKSWNTGLVFLRCLLEKKYELVEQKPERKFQRKESIPASCSHDH